MADNIWPKCPWCETDLERFARDAGKCPKCGACVFEPTAPSRQAIAADALELHALRARLEEHDLICACQCCQEHKSRCIRRAELKSQIAALEGKGRT